MPTIAPIDTGAHVEWAGFIDGTPGFACADGTLVLVAGGEKRLSIEGGITCAAMAQDGKTLVTGGENGAITAIAADGAVAVLRQPNGKWLNALACGPGGAVAAASGRSGVVLVPNSPASEFSSERTIEAITFAPKGMRIALARYNGVELRFVGTQSPPLFLEWKGAHIAVTFSPDGRFLVTSMQENALHGWRLADNRHMRMTGYPAKVKSVSWSPKGKWLASSGAPAAIVWPFSGKDGPMGKAPKELGSMGQTLVTQVACHPAEDVVAIGYQNGMILAVRIEDGKDAVLRRGGSGAISTLGWDAAGRRLAFGSESGEAGIVDIAG
jgi:WD40 repeat protein